MRLKIFATLFCVLGRMGIEAALLPDAADGALFLEKGSRSVGVSAGAAFGATEFGGSVNHDWVVLQIHYGVVATDLLAEERWWGGRLMLVGEFLFAGQYRPNSGVLFGTTPLLRYVFETKGRWKPFVEGGIGVALTDIGAPSLAGTWQFSPQGGVGFFWLLKEDLALTAQQRVVHYSNGGIRSPNPGVNQHMFTVGLTRFY